MAGRAPPHQAKLAGVVARVVGEAMAVYLPGDGDLWPADPDTQFHVDVEAPESRGGEPPPAPDVVWVKDARLVCRRLTHMLVGDFELRSKDRTRLLVATARLCTSREAASLLIWGVPLGDDEDEDDVDVETRSRLKLNALLDAIVSTIAKPTPKDVAAMATASALSGLLRWALGTQEPNPALPGVALPAFHPASPHAVTFGCRIVSSVLNALEAPLALDAVSALVPVLAATLRCFQTASVWEAVSTHGMATVKYVAEPGAASLPGGDCRGAHAVVVDCFHRRRGVEVLAALCHTHVGEVGVATAVLAVLGSVCGGVSPGIAASMVGLVVDVVEDCGDTVLVPACGAFGHLLAAATFGEEAVIPASLPPRLLAAWLTRLAVGGSAVHVAVCRAVLAICPAVDDEHAVVAAVSAVLEARTPRPEAFIAACNTVTRLSSEELTSGPWATLLGSLLDLVRSPSLATHAFVQIAAWDAVAALCAAGGACLTGTSPPAVLHVAVKLLSAYASVTPAATHVVNALLHGVAAVALHLAAGLPAHIPAVFGLVEGDTGPEPTVLAAVCRAVCSLAGDGAGLDDLTTPPMVATLCDALHDAIGDGGGRPPPQSFRLIRGGMDVELVAALLAAIGALLLTEGGRRAGVELDVGTTALRVLRADAGVDAASALCVVANLGFSSPKFPALAVAVVGSALRRVCGLSQEDVSTVLPGGAAVSDLATGAAALRAVANVCQVPGQAALAWRDRTVCVVLAFSLWLRDVHGGNLDGAPCCCGGECCGATPAAFDALGVLSADDNCAVLIGRSPGGMEVLMDLRRARLAKYAFPAALVPPSHVVG